MITPGGSGPRPGGRRRATAGDTAAAFELSDALIGVQRRQHGKHELFEHLTGPEQSWWRCCRDAVRSSDAWLNGNQADQALALIRGEDLARSDGALASAAATTLWISRALTTHDEHRARDLVNKAARGWRNAGPSAPMPDGGTSLSLERALARVDPDLRGRTAALLAVLDGAGREPGQAMAAISVLMLAGVRPGSRTVCMPVTLTAARDGEVIGVAGRITVRTFPGGPAGLFPIPARCWRSRDLTATSIRPSTSPGDSRPEDGPGDDAYCGGSAWTPGSGPGPSTATR